MGEKQFLPVQYRDPVLATKMPEHGVQVEFEDDGSMLSMHPAVRYPDGRVEVVEQALSGPPPDSSHDCLDELVELPGTGDLEFVSEYTVLTECGGCDLCFGEPSPEQTSPGGPTWLRLPVREVHAAFWCPQCLRAAMGAIRKTLSQTAARSAPCCPYCDTEAAVPGARYCYVCGSTMKENGKPHPGEPTFQLYARDPLAPTLIRLWAAQRWSEHADPTLVAEARQCADTMEAWHKEHRS